MSTDPGFGVLDTGFRAKTLTDVQGEINDAILNKVSPTMNLQADTVIGQLVGIFADQITQCWESQQALFASYDPNSACGVPLQNIARFNNIEQLPATPSLVSLRLELNPGATVPAGSQARNAVTDAIFETIDPVTNATASTAFFDVDSRSVDTGPIAGVSGDINIIETPVAGWLSVTNPLDATLGTEIESCQAFRARRLEVLAASGKATLEALVAAVRLVPGVTQVFGIENASPSNPDANGLPAHSFEIVVLGGDDQAIADTIWETKAGGIQAFGSTTVVVTDSQGFLHDIGFSRPNLLDYYIEIDINVNSTVFGDGVQANGEQLVKEALVAYGDALQIGEDILVNPFGCAAYNVAGVTNVAAFRVDTINPPVNTADIAIFFRDLALFDTSRIVVNVI